MLRINKNQKIELLLSLPIYDDIKCNRNRNNVYGNDTLNDDTNSSTSFDILGLVLLIRYFVTALNNVQGFFLPILGIKTIYSRGTIFLVEEQVLLKTYSRLSV